MPEIRLRQPSRCSPFIFILSAFCWSKPSTLTMSTFCFLQHYPSIFFLISFFQLFTKANLTPWQCLPFVSCINLQDFLDPFLFHWIPCPPWFTVQHYICFLFPVTTINLTIYVYDEILIIFTLWCSNVFPTVSWLWFINSIHV